jgi:hypothetical protein
MVKETRRANGGFCPEPKIGAYCNNNGKEGCIKRCAPEGKFRYLDPAPLESWELPPELPKMKELVDLSGQAVRGIFYLALYYRQQEDIKDA